MMHETVLDHYVDLLRGRTWDETGGALYNVIRTMRMARHDKICGEDLTQLDWGSIPFAGIQFSAEGAPASCFDGGKFHEWNFMTGHSGGITSVAYSPKGDLVATASNDGTVILWEPFSGLMVQKLVGHTNAVISVRFTLDGSYCITSSWDGTGKKWMIADGVFFPKASYYYSSSGLSYCSVRSPDGKYVLDGSFLYSKQFEATLMSMETFKSITLNRHTDHVISVAFSSDSQFCLTGSKDGTAMLWKVENGQYIRTLNEHCEAVYSVAFSYDGLYCLTGSSDKTAKLWDLKNGTCLITLKGHTDTITSVSFSPDGKYCLTGSLDRTARLWDAKTGNLIRIMGSNLFPLLSCHLTPNGYHLIAKSWKKTIKIWDMNTRRCTSDINVISDLLEYMIVFPNIDPELPTTVKRIIAYFPQKIATFIQHICKNELTPIAFSPDEKYCLTYSQDNILQLYEIETGHCIHSLRRNIHAKEIKTVAFSPVDNHILIGWTKGNVTLIEMETANQIPMQSFYLNDVVFVAFSPNGLYCVTGSHKKIAQLWEIANNPIIIESAPPLRTFHSPATETEHTEWHFPYCLVHQNGICKIYKFDCFNPECSDKPEYIDTFYNIDGLGIRSCSFRDITADDTTQKILYQYGAEL